MLRRTLRLPSLVVAVLSIPGNVDNLMPQMRLDPHQLANDTAPAVSVVDLLILWAIALTLVEGTRRVPDSFERAALAIAAVTTFVASASAIVALLGGVDVGAVIRGILVFGRVVGVLYLAVQLRDEVGDGRWIAGAMVVAGVALLGNGLYTSTTEDQARFTASTIGRNGFSLALVLASVGSGGFALHMVHGGERRWKSLVAAAVACACLFGAVGTGTRMSLLALIPAMTLGLILTRFWQLRGGTLRVIASITLILITIAVATQFTVEGNRAVSIVTDVGQTVDIITDPESQPSYSPVRSRTYFWQLAASMAADHPVTGVGPFQWNFQRYLDDPDGVRVVADPHNAYLQIASEYGLPTLLGYVALLATVALGAVHALLQKRVAIPFVTTAILVCALIYPITELTNSHLFNVRMGPIGWLFMGSALVALRSLAKRATAVRGRPTC